MLATAGALDAAPPAVAPRAVGPTEAPAATPRGRGSMARRVSPRIPAASSRAIMLLAFILAFTLVADAIQLGIVPGVTVDLASPSWLVYVYALVVLLVAAVAVAGGRLPIRLLLVVSLILFLERAFTPFLGAPPDPISLALHLSAAVVALVLAVVCVAALRSRGPQRAASA
jgi:hypothetical protein